MVVGYDVAHPGKPTRDEIMNKMPPMKPSVVGVSGLFQRTLMSSSFFFSSLSIGLSIQKHLLVIITFKLRDEKRY